MADHVDSSTLINPPAMADPSEIDLEAGPTDQIQCRIGLETDDGDTMTGSQYVPTNGQASPITAETETTQRKVKRLGNFSTDEDIALISAWLNISMNSSVGTDQKGKTFWSKVANNYYENITGLSSERTERSLVCRYADIQKAVNKFMGFVAQVENSCPPGFNEQDKIQKAKTMYREIVGSNFKYEHCWNILRHHPKWLETNGVAGRKRPTTISSPSTPTSVNLAEDCTPSGTFIDLEKPMRNKAVKERQNKGKWKGVDDMPRSDFSCNWKVEKLKMHEHKRKIEEQKLMIATQELEVEEKRIQLEERKEQARREVEERRIMLEERHEEMKIMMMDVSNLSEEQKEYIQLLRAEIIAKRRNM
ncbi:glutathione S-transferase T2-like isoform X2 [Tripterygium wilfordii]|uniref:glutathione S-transferase T2-like isoform X2 n=1 Tax=Tripterygium wilfordii TaxID=458696 RepID=UPI0018F81377|nr:glutathione S-transferase T2-like isoform X2 [Tripterygium wilfordii]